MQKSSDYSTAIIRNRIGERYAEPIEFDEASPWYEKFDKLRLSLGGGFLFALIGKRGTGKTRMAAELIRISRYSGDDVKYASSIGFLGQLKDTFDNGGERRVFDSFAKARLVILDDCHRRGDSDWRNSMIDELVGQRYNRRLDTLLISNETLPVFKDAIGLDIYSRLTEAGGIMVCDWESFRRPL